MRKVKTEARYIHNLFRQFRSTALPTLCSNYVTHSIVSPKQSQDAFHAPMQTFLRHSADYIQQDTLKAAKWIAPKITSFLACDLPLEFQNHLLRSSDERARQHLLRWVQPQGLFLIRDFTKLRVLFILTVSHHHPPMSTLHILSNWRHR
jgi:hypothetical protein